MPIVWVHVQTGSGGSGTCTAMPMMITGAAGGGTGTAAVWVNAAATTSSTTTWNTIMGGAASSYQEQITQQAMMMMLAQQQCAGTTSTCNNSYANIQPETAEVRAEREERYRREHEQRRRREQERADAQRKARELLLSHLTPEQRDTVAKHNWFVVEGGLSKKRYRIRTTGVAGNIDELDADGHTVASLCCHATELIPPSDQHLTQKLMLESDEQEFIARANRRQLR